MKISGVVTGSVIMFGGLMLAPVAGAQPVCADRSASHAAEHGTTVAADSRWHVSRGELPTCGADSGESVADTREDSVERFDDDNRDSDRKSRYCRKHWFC